MTKSFLDIQIQLIQNSILTVNEVRALEGFADFVGLQNEDRNANKFKNECLYCNRPNEWGKELCESCGAPLKY